MKLACEILYILSAICFIVGLKGLSNPKTARRGNLFSAVGMGIAIVTSLLYPIELASGKMISPVNFAANNYFWILGGLMIGSLIGWQRAVKVEMTAMPQLVSIFNGFGGLSAMLLGILEALKFDNETTILQSIIVFSAMVIGAISFSGSVLAYLKLDGKVKDKHVMLPAHNIINLLLLALTIGSVVFAIMNPSTLSIAIAAVLALVYGFSFVAPIGGADMPVVISLLNSVTGISAAVAGYLYDNQIMILGGILVGASGTILTLLMCRAMNRSILNVVAGGFGSAAVGAGVGAAAGGDEDRTIQEASPIDIAILLNYANQVIMVPGYGMAVAQAQKQAKELDTLLTEKGVEVFYGIHPVAGRMPGHMNVLLAEVDISYDKLLDLDDCNSRLTDTDIVLIIGANDVVNPSALDDPSSNIYGMPILEVWNAKQTVVFKRSMKPGYAGIQNPLFFHDNNKMLFGDAKDSLGKIIDELKTL